MSYSTIVKTSRDGTIKLTDNGGTSLTVAFEGEGNFSYDGDRLADRLPIYDRGQVVGVRKGNDPAFITASFDINLRQLASDQTNGSVIDFINKTNAYSGLVSTSTTSDFFTCTLEYSIEGTDVGDLQDSKVVMSEVVLSYSVSEGMPSTVTITAECYGTVSRTYYTS